MQPLMIKVAFAAFPLSAISFPCYSQPSHPEDRMSENFPGRGSIFEIFLVFLKLGCTSFGGPVAHLGYFRQELVQRRHWIDETGYGDLVALCQFLPGPASSQVGFGLGLLRGGPFGALAAFIGFTLPSALLLVLFAYGATMLDGPLSHSLINGLKIVAVAIVAQAVWGMARNLCPDRERASIAFGAALLLLLAGPVGQLVALGLGAFAGLMFCRTPGEEVAHSIRFPVTKTIGALCLATYGLLLVFPSLIPVAAVPVLSVFNAFYRSGALVFGGGHVVLPLLEAEVARSGWVSHEQFLAGYAAAQAVPGPLFTFAAYLGVVLKPEPNGLWGAGIALFGIFLPGFLILLGIVPFWESLRQRKPVQAAMRGTNAAVVGILGAALYDPVFTSAITGPKPFALTLVGFILLQIWKLPPWLVVFISAIGGVVIGFAG